MTHTLSVISDDAAMAIVFDDEGHWRFRHTCARTSPRFVVAQEPFVVAPTLDRHTVMVAEHRPSVNPSILCEDCGIHGFVNDGKWRSA